MAILSASGKQKDNIDKRCKHHSVMSSSNWCKTVDGQNVGLQTFLNQCVISNRRTVVKRKATFVHKDPDDTGTSRYKTGNTGVTFLGNVGVG